MTARARAVAAVCLFLVLPCLELQSQESELADEYLRRLVAVWQQEASRADVEAWIELLASSAVYEHPRVGVRIEGRSMILEAMAGFVGTSRLPKIAALDVIEGPGVIVLGFDLSMEVHGKDGWRGVRPSCSRRPTAW